MKRSTTAAISRVFDAAPAPAIASSEPVNPAQSLAPELPETGPTPFVVNPHENRYHELARLRERASRAYEKNTRTAHVARAHETRVAAQIKADAAATKLPALREALAAIAHLAPKSHEDAAAWEYHEMYRYQTTGEFFAYSSENVSARLLELEAIAPKAAEYRRTERARILALPTPTENELAAERAAEAARIENVSRAIASAFRSAIPDAAGSRTFTF